MGCTFSAQRKIQPLKGRIFPIEHDIKPTTYPASAEKHVNNLRDYSIKPISPSQANIRDNFGI